MAERAGHAIHAASFVFAVNFEVSIELCSLAVSETTYNCDRTFTACGGLDASLFLKESRGSEMSFDYRTGSRLVLDVPVMSRSTAHWAHTTRKCKESPHAYSLHGSGRSGGKSETSSRS